MIVLGFCFGFVAYVRLPREFKVAVLGTYTYINPLVAAKSTEAMFLRIASSPMNRLENLLHFKTD